MSMATPPEPGRKCLISLPGGIVIWTTSLPSATVWPTVGTLRSFVRWIAPKSALPGLENVIWTVSPWRATE